MLTSAHDRSRFRQMWKAGVPCAEIGAAFGGTGSDASRWARQLQLPKRRPGRGGNEFSDPPEAIRACLNCKLADCPGYCFNVGRPC